jgi:hypothetical protein
MVHKHKALAAAAEINGYFMTTKARIAATSG